MRVEPHKKRSAYHVEKPTRCGHPASDDDDVVNPDNTRIVETTLERAGVRAKSVIY